jgi:hypothetical protein
MAFTPHTQNELKQLNITAGQSYPIEYANKDYFNGEDTIEKAIGTAIQSDDNIYFTVTDPYGMDKMVMQVRILEK